MAYGTTAAVQKPHGSTRGAVAAGATVLALVAVVALVQSYGEVPTTSKIGKLKEVVASIAKERDAAFASSSDAGLSAGSWRPSLFLGV